MNSATPLAKTLIVIEGATATGKTEVGIRLAQAFDSAIISSDSRQIYREMTIGTAKPTPEELAAAPHHMIGIHSVTEPYSAGRYAVEALAQIETLFRQHDRLFLVGGSGLYIDALCYGMDDLPEIDPLLRQQLNHRLQTEGLEPLVETLRQCDPTYWEQVDRSNPQRIIRALEVTLQSGKPFSAWRQGRRVTRPFRIVKLALRMPREQLYDRINRRVDRMVEEGLEQEARDLYPLRSYNALQTVGYREWFDHFEGLLSREEAIEQIKRNSRRYAKRQFTWFGRETETLWFDAGPRCADAIVEYLT